MKQKHRRVVCRVRGHLPPVYLTRHQIHYDPETMKYRYMGDKTEKRCPRCGRVFSVKDRTITSKDAT